MNSPARFGLAGAIAAVVLLVSAACSRSPDSPSASTALVAKEIPAPTPAVAPVNSRRENAAVQAAMDLVDPRRRASEFARLLRAWLGQDPEAALDFVRHLPPGAEHTSGVLLALEATSGVDPDRALALARELIANREERAFYNSFFAHLAAADPLVAVSKLPAVPAGDARERAVRALADAWAATDLPAALTWAQQLGPADRAPALEAVLTAMTAVDPRRAADLARQNLSGAALERTLTTAIQALTLSDPRDAAAMVGFLPPGEMPAGAAFDVARALAAQAPAEALAWMRILPPGPMQRAVLNNILEVWAAQNPTAAAGYVAQMATGPDREGAVDHMARLLARADPAQATDWARTLATEAEQGRAAIAIGSAWAQRDPAGAAQWIMSEPFAPPEALRGVLSYWRLRDPAAAQAWLAAAKLSPEIKARLLSPPSTP